MNPQDYEAIVQGLKSRLGKDAYRISFFIAAVTKKAGTLPVKDISAFQKSAFVLIGDWINEAIKLTNVKKWSFALLFKDPFHDLRQRTRLFAREWNLDPDFIEVMG